MTFGTEDIDEYFICTDVFNFHRPGCIYTVYILMFTFIALLKSPMKCKWCYSNC